jgi:hypothetical protein
MTSKDLGPLEFKAEDAEFKKAYGVPGTTGLQTEIEFISIETANRLLAERLTKLDEIFLTYMGEMEGHDEYQGGTCPYGTETHRARLACVRKLEGK